MLVDQLDYPQVTVHRGHNTIEGEIKAMVSIPENTPSIASTIAFRLASLLANRATKANTRVRTEVPVMQKLVRLVFHIAGFACLTVAGFSFSFIAGMIVAGVSCFLMSTLTTVSKVSTELNTPPRLR